MARIPGVTYDGPPRGYGNSGAKKLYIAIHNTSNDAPPKNEANYAQVRTDNISSHFYADASTVIQSLDTAKDAWHAGSSWGNQRAIAFELVGTNSSSEAYWRKVIDRVAPVMAAVCKAHGIPARSLSVTQAKGKSLPGFVTHDDMRQAWGGTTHNDPGPNFPEAYLISKVAAVLNGAPVNDVEEDDMYDDQARNMDTATTNRALGILRNDPTVEYTIGGVKRTEVNGVYVALKAIEDKIEALSAPSTGGPINVDIPIEVFKDAIREVLREGVA